MTREEFVKRYGKEPQTWLEHDDRLGKPPEMETTRQEALDILDAALEEGAPVDVDASEIETDEPERG